MEDTRNSNYNGGYTNLKRLLLVLCLAGLKSATVLSIEEENGMSPDADDSSKNDELEVFIAGPDYVTVGVPFSFECEADCPSNSSCTYSMALDSPSVQGQGNVLAFTLPEWVETLNITCTAKDDHTGQAGTITKKLQVLAGPANISILGSDLMYTHNNSYSCHAYCRPSCNYTWRIDRGHWITGLGNVITVTPKELETSKTLTCKARNSVSGLFVSAISNLLVTYELEVFLAGPDYVTVGVPFSFECEADCPSNSSCTYSMALDSQSVQGQGNVLAFTLPEWVETLNITCTAKDDHTGQAGTITKKLQVLAGPANISILGSDLMYTQNNSYSCHAYCRPSCNYTWRIDRGHWITELGNVITVTPEELETSKTLTCKARNSVSGLFVSAIRNLLVTSGPSEIKIEGPDYVEMWETSKFICVAQCIPPCRYVLFVDGQTVRGNEIVIAFDKPMESLTVKCEAQNPVSMKSEVVLKTLRLSGHSKATRAEQTSALLLCAFVFSTVISL